MSRLSSALSSLGLAPELAPELENFTVIFKKWNDSINLSAARNLDEIAEHVIDSLHVVSHLRAVAAATRSSTATDPNHPNAPTAPMAPSTPSAVRVLDVGSGGGLPAVIAAICLPDIQFTALEPVHKKHAFLRTATRELGLRNLDPRAERLELHPQHDYDAAMSRATFDLRDWLQLGLSRVRPDGTVIGFEATRRDDLPAGAHRHPYEMTGKTRAIITLSSPSDP